MTRELAFILCAILVGLVVGTLLAVHDLPPVQRPLPLPARLIPGNVIDDRVLTA